MPRIAALMAYPVEGCRGVRVKAWEPSPLWRVEPQSPALGRVFVEPHQSELRLACAGQERLVLTGPDDADQASAWFSKLLGEPAHVRWEPSPKVSLRVVTTASLAALNQTQPKRIAVEHFRPHLVVEGTGPWDEEQWVKVSVGGATFTVTKLKADLRETFGVLLENPTAAPQLRAGQSLDLVAQ